MLECSIKPVESISYPLKRLFTNFSLDVKSEISALTLKTWLAMTCSGQWLRFEGTIEGKQICVGEMELMLENSEFIGLEIDCRRNLN